MYIAELDGRPAGCAYLVTLVDYFNQRSHAHLSVLAVSKDAEGNGRWVCAARSVGRVGEGAPIRSPDLERAGHEQPRSCALRAKGFGGEYIRYVLPL